MNCATFEKKEQIRKEFLTEKCCIWRSCQGKNIVVLIGTNADDRLDFCPFLRTVLKIFRIDDHVKATT